MFAIIDEVEILIVRFFICEITTASLNWLLFKSMMVYQKALAITAVPTQRMTE